MTVKLGPRLFTWRLKWIVLVSVIAITIQTQAAEQGHTEACAATNLKNPLQDSECPGVQVSTNALPSDLGTPGLVMADSDLSHKDHHHEIPRSVGSESPTVEDPNPSSTENIDKVSSDFISVNQESDHNHETPHSIVSDSPSLITEDAKPSLEDYIPEMSTELPESVNPESTQIYSGDELSHSDHNHETPQSVGSDSLTTADVNPLPSVHTPQESTELPTFVNTESTQTYSDDHDVNHTDHHHETPPSAGSDSPVAEGANPSLTENIPQVSSELPGLVNQESAPIYSVYHGLSPPHPKHEIPQYLGSDTPSEDTNPAPKDGIPQGSTELPGLGNTESAQIYSDEQDDHDLNHTDHQHETSQSVSPESPAAENVDPSSTEHVPNDSTEMPGLINLESPQIHSDDYDLNHTDHQHETPQSVGSDSPIAEDSDSSPSEHIDDFVSVNPDVEVSHTDHHHETPQFVGSEYPTAENAKPSPGDSYQESEETTESPQVSEDSSEIPQVSEETTEIPAVSEESSELPESAQIDSGEHDDHDHSHAHHHHETPESEGSELPTTEDAGPSPTEQIEKISSNFISVVRYISYSLLFFLPEHLQDSILDVNDALILTGIIALTLVSVCVPYFFIETYMALRPLKKKVVELNRNLWKVTTAYENQQEDLDSYKAKALAYDEEKAKNERLEAELEKAELNKMIIKKYQKDLRFSSKVATDVESHMGNIMKERDEAVEELAKMKKDSLDVQQKYKKINQALQVTHSETVQLSTKIIELTHSNEMQDRVVKTLEKEIAEYKGFLQVEGEKRRAFENDADKYLTERDSLQKELTDLKTILHQYEETVNNLSQEISLKENELMLLRENLGDDSPLVEAAELSAKLNVAQGNASALQLRVDSLTLEHKSLSQNLKEITKSAKTLESDKEHAENKLQVLESYFKEKEEELRTMVEKYESEKLTRGMDKEGLISRIEEKEDDIRELNRRIEAMKEELENTKLSHRNEFRQMEAKEHEHWLLLCQSERKLQEARKESETLRQKLTALSREKEADGLEEVDGDMKMNYFSMIPSDLIPAPLPDDVGPTYIGLGRNFIPPPPLDDEDDDDDDDLSPSRDRESMRPPPLGRRSPNFSENGHDDPLSPIGPTYDYSSGSYSPSRESWINGNDRGSENRRNHRDHPRTSSPINHGVNV